MWEKNSVNVFWIFSSYASTQNNEGISTDADYPYRQKRGDCAYDENDANADLYVTGVVTVEPGNEAALQSAVCNGPVAVAINTPRRFVKCLIWDRLHGKFTDIFVLQFPTFQRRWNLLWRKMCAQQSSTCGGRGWIWYRLLDNSQ
jgi:Papain family cysteine protease